jgi:hypothetical protein
VNGSLLVVINDAFQVFLHLFAVNGEIFILDENSLIMATHSLGRSEFGNPSNKGNTLTPEEANELLNDWVKNDRLRLHMRQVAHLMKSLRHKRRNHLMKMISGNGNLPFCFTMPTGINGR